MDRDSMQERKNTLEEEFFRKQNAEVVERLRSTRERSQAHEELAATSGITDPATLDRLIAHGVSPESIAAVALVPLVAVAWADHKIEDKERKAVLEEAAKSGLTPEMPGYEMLAGWLAEAPPATLMAAWTEYASVLAADMDASDRETFRTSLVERATAIAKAAGGGFAGFGSKVSDAEQRVLDQVAAALSG